MHHCRTRKILARTQLSRFRICYKGQTTSGCFTSTQQSLLSAHVRLTALAKHLHPIAHWHCCLFTSDEGRKDIRQVLADAA